MGTPAARTWDFFEVSILLQVTAKMSFSKNTDLKHINPDEYLPPRDDEINLTISRDWTKEEERRAKRK